MRTSLAVLPLTSLLIFGAAPLRSAPDAQGSAADRAEATLHQMTPEEKAVLTAGIMPLPILPHSPKPPADAIPAAGYVPGIPRLNVPALRETDASLGVAYALGVRKDGATALPATLALAATWNEALAREAGEMIGGEAHAKGFNVMLAGGANLIREPRGGRSFEYLSEDPLLTGTLAGATIAGIQSKNVISTIKHLAFNDQETGRRYVDSIVSDAAARESDLLAFQIGIETGRPGSVMCAYNKVNGAPACGSDYLLNNVLKTDWRYPGFVMSDWGGTPGLPAALAGLDQQSAAELDTEVYFREKLARAASENPAYAARLDDMNRRILRSIYAAGLDRNPARPGGRIDFNANGAVAQKVAEQAIVLLRNRSGFLPLGRNVKRIAVIGGYAHAGVLSGGGSSQVQGETSPLKVPMPVEDPASAFISQMYHPSSPLKAIRAKIPAAAVTFRQGEYLSEAVAQAKAAEVVIIFATKWSTEGLDVPDLTLPNGQDALIEAVTAANPNTIVVLETGNPVAMPWLERTAAVMEAWYPGARGGDAIANVLFGDVNPSGRLPVTFPANIDQLPRRDIAGFDTTAPNISGAPPTPEAKLSVDYDIEGSDVGYRWFARKGLKPLFPFGFGLSYTQFRTHGLKVTDLEASFSVSNVGAKPGATVAQLYLVNRNGKAKSRLVGYRRVELRAGETRSVVLAIDPRLLADWRDGSWRIEGGSYGFALGDDAQTLGERKSVTMKARAWRD